MAVGVAVPQSAGAYTPAAPWEPVALATEAGGLLFFNATGHQIMGGNISTKPIAAYIEGTSVANASDDKATLYGYTPVNGVGAGQWSGEELGGAVKYPNASAPAPLNTSALPVYTSPATEKSLSTYTESYPNKAKSTTSYAGLYVLRLKFSNTTGQAKSYDAADIKITGTTWKVVYPTSVTTVGAAPASPQDFGTKVTFTATITPSSATGSVQFLNRTTDIGSPVTVKTGTASITTTALPAGKDIVNAVFTPTGTGANSGSVGNLVYTVDSDPTKTTLTTTPLTQQQFSKNVKLTAKVTPGSAPGTVKFTEGTTVLGTEAVSAGSASITVSTFPIGTQTVTATFTPSSGDYAKSSGKASIKITPIATKTTLKTVPATSQAFGDNVKLEASVTPSAVGGTVQFEDGSKPLGTAVSVSNGTASLTVSTLALGTHALSAVLSPSSGDYAGSTGKASITITPDPTKTTLTATPATSQYAGSTVTLTATVTPPAAAGTVEFKLGTTVLGTQTVKSGKASLVTSSLTAGADTLVAIFSPTSGDYAKSTGSLKYTVKKVTATTTKLTVTPTSPQNYGTTVTLKATVTPSTAHGTVKFKVGSTVLGTRTVSGGSASLSTKALPVGKDTVTAIFTPTADSGYGTSTHSTSYTVAPDPTKTTLTPSPVSPQQFGTTVTLKASVTPPTAPGTVQFKVGSTVLGKETVSGGSASLSTTALPLGTDSLVAVFTPSSLDFKGSTGTASYQITSIPTTTTLTPSPASPQYAGTTVTLKASVTPPNAPGTVQFKVGTKVLGTKTVSGGSASLSTTELTVGADTLVAVFSPSSVDYKGSTGTARFTVNPVTATSLTITPSPASPQFVGTTVTLKATVTPPNAPGTVQFKVGSTLLGTKTVSGGTASLPTTALPAGTDSITGIFTPSSNGYKGSTDVIGYKVIALTATTTTLTASPASPQTYGTSITLTASIAPSGAQGVVQFSVDGSDVGGPVAVSSGKASITTTSLPAGNNSLTAVYSPTRGSGFAGSTGTASFTVSGHTGKGYWLVASDGGIFAYGTAPFYGSMGGQPLNEPIVGIASTPDGKGYWEVASDGGIFAFGDAGFYGSMGGQPLNEPIVGIASTPDGKGYWEVASDGGIFAFGDAGFYGSMGGQPLNKPIVGIASTPDGRGYWMVASDGGIFAFGDAGFYGSTGSLTLAQPVVGMVSTPDGDGYWLAAADGGLFAFGDAGYFGSVPGANVHVANIVGIAASPDGGGYWEVGSNGGVYAFGDAPFDGSAGSLTLVQPVVGLAET